MGKKGKNGATVNTAFVLPIFLLAALYALWPLGTSAQPHDHADTLFNAWLVRWNIHAAVSGENPLDLPIFSGFSDGQGRNDLLITQSAAAFPLYIAGADPVRSHNILLVFFLVLSGWGAFFLAEQSGTGFAGAAFTGTAVILLPWFQSHLWHLQLFSGGLGLMAIGYALKASKGETSGWQVALFILLQCLASLYMWFFMNMALVLLLPFLFPGGNKKGILRTAGWFTAGNAACMPFLLKHLSHAGRWSADTIASTDLTAFLAPWGNSVLLGWMRPAGIHPEAALWPGLAVTAGFLWYLFKGEKKTADWYLILCTVVFAVLSLGPTLVVAGRELAPAPFRLLAVLPGASSIRLPARGAFFALVPMAILAGRMLGRKPVLAAAGVFLAAAGLFHLPVETLPLEPQPWHDWLAGQHFSRVLYLPVSCDVTRPETEALRLIGSVSHFTPSVNGYSTTLPEDYSHTAEVLNGWPSPEAVRMAEALKVECIVAEGHEHLDCRREFRDRRITISVIVLSELNR